MPSRLCLGSPLHPPGHTLTDGSTRCPDCTDATRRGTTTERGYGYAYQQERDAVVNGATRCTNCGDPLTEDNPATGGHVEALRHGGTLADGLAAQCARCNYGWRRTGT